MVVKKIGYQRYFATHMKDHHFLMKKWKNGKRAEILVAFM
jgi:hypothetical protein